ncbi:TonB-dependent receptor [Massilia sp. Dwa41.01b]|uniref:TonB-dependent receptor n=1 Tax=unclassified Massilia TaxID=2609279 RepID=UPI0016002EFB|nr:MULTISPECIES: TonB-dependent receptor [unclassified Massilia]QNA87744.1 TonB-dependent receptor [Massilia sp. Dwa41.01b]QNA98650.1 TonB-dependent receptor [Massilia sp. Se16.2.3]
MNELKARHHTKHTAIAAAVMLLVAGSAFEAHAQEQAPGTGEPVQQVVVTGVRAALEQSLRQKRGADSVVEVVTAEDIGKMPDKNVADAIQRLPGVNTQSSAGGEGGFGENDRVSLRGTSPSLQQTLFNGHAISTGDWFLLNQIGGNVGRSSSFSLLPSELVGSIVVQKSPTADLVEGGVSGAINVITRRPLDFRQPLTVEGSIQANYNDLSGKTEPHISGLVSWKNAANTAGFLLQGFSEKAAVRRDGQEILGYTPIDPTSAAAVANPSLAGVVMPTFIGASLFEQTKKRSGGAFDFELRPMRGLSLDVNGFYSELKAPHLNTNWLAAPANSINRDGLIPQNPVVRNNTLVGAGFTANSGEVDNIYRPNAGGESWYLDFNGKFKVNDDLTVSGKLGKTHGVGYDRDDVFYQNNVDGGMVYALNGLSPASVSYPGGNTAVPGSTAWAGGGEAQSVDQEKYAQVDADWRVRDSIVTMLRFGARFTDHHRTAEHPLETRPGPNGFSNPGPAWNGQMYPSDFARDLGGNLSSNYFKYDGAALGAWGAVPGNRLLDYTLRHNWTDEFQVGEKTSALYGMAEFGGDRWSGNAGLRAVETRQNTVVNLPGGPNPVTGSAFGPYTPTTFKRTYRDYLPSVNVKFDAREDLVLRAALAKTIARPDYSALGGSVSLNDDALSGSGGNVNLDPVRSTNFDLSAEWYFAPKALLSAGFFYMDLRSIVAQGTSTGTYYNNKRSAPAEYQITSPFNTTGTNKGIELSWQQPLWNNFGFLANYTYADGELDDGGELLNSSKRTWNLTGFFENERFSARLAYNFRSAYKAGVDRGASQHVDDMPSLAASVNVKLTEQLTLTFDALNLTNETIKMYAENKDRPRAFYSNGRTFYVGIRGKL